MQNGSSAVLHVNVCSFCTRNEACRTVTVVTTAGSAQLGRAKGRITAPEGPWEVSPGQVRASERGPGLTAKWACSPGGAARNNQPGYYFPILPANDLKFTTRPTLELSSLSIAKDPRLLFGSQKRQTSHLPTMRSESTAHRLRYNDASTSDLTNCDLQG